MSFFLTFLLSWLGPIGWKGVKEGLVCAESFAPSFIQEEKKGLAWKNRFQSERISRASSKDRHGTESNKWIKRRRDIEQKNPLLRNWTAHYSKDRHEHRLLLLLVDTYPAIESRTDCPFPKPEGAARIGFASEREYTVSDEGLGLTEGAVWHRGGS